MQHASRPGVFSFHPVDAGKVQVTIDGSTFASLLAGIDFTAARRGWYRRSGVDLGRLGIDTDLRA